MSTVIQELFAVLGVKVDKGEFADAFALLDKLGTAFSVVFNGIEAAMGKAIDTVHTTAMAGDEFLTTSEKFGIAAAALQELQYAAIASDASAEGLNNGLKFLGKNAAEAAKGSESAAAAFKGINLKGANGQLRSTDDLLGDVASKFAAMPDGTEKANLALEIFGKSGQELIPMLNRGADGIDGLRNKARELGGVMSGELLEASGRYDDALKDLTFSWKGITNAFSGPIIPKFTAVFEKLTKLLSTRGVARAVEFLSRAFGHLVDGVELLIDVMDSFAKNTTLVETALFGVSTVVAGLAVAAVFLGAQFVAAAGSAIAAWVAAAAPFILIGALIALIVDEIATFIRGGDSMLGRMIKWFDQIDPDNNPLIELLRSAGSLLFDLADTKKWERFGKAMFNALVYPLELATNLIFKGLSLLGFKGNGGVITPEQALAQSSHGFGTKTPEVPALFSSMPALPEGARGPTSSAAVSSSTTSNRSMMSINAPVNVSVANGDPAVVGPAVRDAVREELSSQMRDALASQGGN